MTEDERKRELTEATRVVREHGRVTTSSVEFTDELERLRNDPAHYMTPGARKYFRRVALGYIILALGMTIGIKALSDNVDDNIRNDINQVAEANCLGSIPTFNKFNNLVENMIDSNRGARMIAQAEGDIARVKLTTANIIKLQESKLRVPNVKECSAPILK
jgi:hypothetical protein